jgi:hypothetical protein
MAVDHRPPYRDLFPPQQRQVLGQYSIERSPYCKGGNQMRKAILRLLRTIRAISLESTNLPELAGTIPPPGRLPPPWISWTLLGLIYYLDRKLWAWETVCERLGPHVERDSEPKDPERIIDFLQQGEQGILPGFPDWSYWLNQNLIDLTHRGTGEQIHLDLLTEPKLTNIAQFVSFIKAFRVPNPIIGRLRTLSPSGAGIESALHVLHENDIIDIDCLRIITIPRKLFGAAGAIQQFLTKWEMPENRMPLAVRLGDWLLTPAQ